MMFQIESLDSRFLFVLVVQEEIFVSRAPGRLDVIGGIADYSGSLVLQVKFLFPFYIFLIYAFHASFML